MDKEVEIFEWMKKQGYDRRASKDIAPIIVKYLEQHGATPAVSGSLPRRCSYIDCPDTAVHCGRTDCGRNIGHIRQ